MGGLLSQDRYFGDHRFVDVAFLVSTFSVFSIPFWGERERFEFPI